MFEKRKTISVKIWFLFCCEGYAVCHRAALSQFSSDTVSSFHFSNVRPFNHPI